MRKATVNELSYKLSVDETMRKKNIVLATGAFDLLHYGHLRFLEESKRLGGRNSELIVLIARDKTAARLKGKKPVMSENERRALVASLKPVDKALLGFRKFSIRKIVRKVKPDIIALGYDQDEVKKAVERVVRQNGSKIKVIQVRRFGSPDLSSSKIKRRVIESWGKL
jgi:FAD synthetase